MKFQDVAKRLLRFNLNKSFTKAFTPGVLSSIPDMIEARIYSSGVTGDGVKLKTDFSKGSSFYSENTVYRKTKKGQKTSNVTLRDSGEFWNSAQARSNSGFLTVKANFEKETGHIHENFMDQFDTDTDFENSVLSLTVEEKYEIANKLKPSILNDIRNL